MFAASSARESNVVDMCASHSSGSNGWREMWWLEVCTRRDFLNLFPHTIENQIATRREHPSHMCNLKPFALHVQILNHRYRCECQLRAGFINDCLGHGIFLFCRFYNVFTKSGQAFVCD